jgi:sRNA-binding protein
MARRIRVKGVPRKELDASTISYVFWTMAKRQVEEKRQREQQERDKRQERKGMSS